MLTNRKVAPGQNRTKKLLAQYSAQLVYIRCRYDRQKPPVLQTPSN